MPTKSGTVNRRADKALRSDAAHRTLKTLTRIERKLDTLLRKDQTIMAQIEDLKTAVDGLKQAVADELTRVAADLEAFKADNPVVATAITDLNAVTAAVTGFDPHSPVVPTMKRKR